MILTPQEASIMRGRPYDKIIQSLQRAVALNKLTPLAESNGSVLAVIDNDDVIPFTIPQQIFDNLGREYYCIDLRKSAREYTLSEDGRTYTPSFLTEANFLTNFALAQKTWINQISDYNSIYWDAGQIYAMWIGMKVAKRLALTPLQQSEMICYFAYYYFTQPYRGEKLGDFEYTQIVNKICQLLRFNPQEVTTILAPFEQTLFKTFDELCEKIGAVTDNPKLKKMNRVLVQTLLIGSWVGQNERELVALASEYPPCFMTLLYRGLNERTFKDSDIVQVAFKLMNTAKQKQYNLVFADILKRAAGQ